MAYVLLDENNIVIQKDIQPIEGFIEAPDDVICGQIKQGDNYVNPVIPVDEINNQVDQMRRSAYIAEADPLYFKWQRGDANQEEWLNKIKEIKSLYPKE